MSGGRILFPISGRIDRLQTSSTISGGCSRVGNSYGGLSLSCTRSLTDHSPTARGTVPTEAHSPSMSTCGKLARSLHMQGRSGPGRIGAVQSALMPLDDVWTADRKWKAGALSRLALINI